MRMIAPALDGRRVRIAEDQDEYLPVEAVLTTNPSHKAVSGSSWNTVVLTFRPSDSERAQLANGADIYVALLTFGTPMQPIMVKIGPEVFADIYGLEITDRVGNPIAAPAPDREGSERAELLADLEDAARAVNEAKAMLDDAPASTADKARVMDRLDNLYFAYQKLRAAVRERRS